MSDNDKFSGVIFLLLIFLLLLSCSTSKSIIREKRISNRVAIQSKVVKRTEKKEEKAPDIELYLRAKKAFDRGDFRQCMTLLREERLYLLSDFSKMKNLYLSGLCQLETGDIYRAKYFFKQVIAGASRLDYKKVNSAEVKRLLGRVYFSLGLIFYDEKLYNQSLNYMSIVVKKYVGILTEQELSKVYLIMSDVLYYREKKIPLARFYFKKINFRFLQDKDKSLYGMLREGLKWESIKCARIGLADENISVLTCDGNDLWIGTWNGGLARYNMYRNETKVFKAGRVSIVPRTIRAIQVIGQNVWIGSYDGLSYYSKRSGKWYNVKTFNKLNRISVEAIERVGSKVYVGTLGKGLWVLSLNAYLNIPREEKWKKIDIGGALKFINCMASYKNYLIIGTMDKGVFFFDTENDELTNLATLSVDFKPVNITTLLIENDDSLWIGTYGKGLFNWNPKTNELKIFTKENGMLSDDWVLGSGKGERFLYFGTFGGGVMAFDRIKKEFKVFTLESGLDSMDISSVAVLNSNIVAFGTLGMGISLYFGENN